MNEGNADINEDSDCSSQSVSIDKHSETHLNEDTHSRSTEKHLNMEKNSGKIHPIVKVSSETTPEKEDVEKDCESVEQHVSCEEKNELDRISSCSSTSKTSDVNCVGINSVDTFNDVSAVAEKNVTHDGDPHMSHMLYNLYTISVSTLIFLLRMQFLKLTIGIGIRMVSSELWIKHARVSFSKSVKMLLTGKRAVDNQTQNLRCDVMPSNERPHA